MQDRKIPSLFVFDDHLMALGHSTYEYGKYGDLSAYGGAPSVFDTTRQADEVSDETYPDSIYIHPTTEWVDALLEKERDKRKGVEATTRACRHGHLADASRLLLDGTVLPCNECLLAASVDEASEGSTSKEPATKQGRDDLIMAVRTDHELQEPLLEIEGGPQSPELVSASIHADDEVPLEGSHRESRESQTAEFSAQASDEADVLQAGGEDGGDVVAASSYSEQSVTPEPSRLSATRSGAARSSTKTRGRKAGATASSDNTTIHKSLDRTKSAAGKEAEAMKKTDAGHYFRSYERALSILDAFAAGKPVATVLDAALLAVRPYDPLPGDITPLPMPAEGKLQRKELRDRRETRQSFCMVCQMQFGKLRGASFYRPHRTEICALWRVLVALDLATKWLKVHNIDESICGRMQFESKFKPPRSDNAYHTMENDKCKGYDEEGWRMLGMQLEDKEAKKIKAKLPADVSALRMTIITERDARLATIRAASADDSTAGTSARSRKRRAEDEGERARGSKRKRVAEETGAEA